MTFGRLVMHLVKEVFQGSTTFSGEGKNHWKKLYIRYMSWK